MWTALHAHALCELHMAITQTSLGSEQEDQNHCHCSQRQAEMMKRKWKERQGKKRRKGLISANHRGNQPYARPIERSAAGRNIGSFRKIPDEETGRPQGRNESMLTTKHQGKDLNRQSQETVLAKISIIMSLVCEQIQIQGICRNYIGVKKEIKGVESKFTFKVPELSSEATLIL